MGLVVPGLLIPLLPVTSLCLLGQHLLCIPCLVREAETTADRGITMLQAGGLILDSFLGAVLIQIAKWLAFQGEESLS